jgi:hypothetical protein
MRARLEAEHAERPDVDGCVVVRALHHLRRQVVQRAAQRLPARRQNRHPRARVSRALGALGGGQNAPC